MGLSFVHPVTFLLQRFTISAVVLSPIPLLLRKRIPQDSDTLVKLTLFCLMCVLGITAMHVGLVEESSGIGAVLTYTQPLFVYCLAVPFLKERVTAIKVLGILAGFVGVVVLFLGKVGSFTFNSALIMLFAAFSWAVSVVYYKKHLSHIDPFIANFFQLPISIFPLDLLSVFTKSFVFPVDTTYLWIILYVSVGPLVVGWTIWLFLLKEEEATVVSGSSFIVPLAALFFGWQILGENVSVQSMVGAALVLGGMYLVNLKTRCKETVSENCEIRPPRLVE